jgi:nicotinamidase-related amidase
MVTRQGMVLGALALLALWAFMSFYTVRPEERSVELFLGESSGIGDPGPMGRILVRGEYGHDIVDELKPAPGEPVVDKPGKGAFYATDLDALLHNRGVRQLVVCGVTTEVCVNTSVREANDRGYDCLVLEDCVGSYFPEFQVAALNMIKAQGGIFGWVSDSQRFLEALARA